MNVIISDKLNQKFGFTTGGIGLVLTVWQYINHHIVIWLSVPGALLVLCALFIPPVLTPLRSIWERAGNIMGVINTAIILFLLYFLFITPIGLILQLLNKTAFDRNFNIDADSYWNSARATGSGSMKQQF